MFERKRVSVCGIYILLVFIFGCSNNEQKTYKEVNKGLAVYSDVNDSLFFAQVKKYIQKNGKHERVSLSSIINDTNLMVDYYSVLKNDWEVTVDHSNRIYFSKDNVHYGNVILQSDSVFVEPYYLGSKEKIDTLNEIIRPINEVYESLIKSISK